MQTAKVCMLCNHGMNSKQARYPFLYKCNFSVDPAVNVSVGIFDRRSDVLPAFLLHAMLAHSLSQT